MGEMAQDYDYDMDDADQRQRQKDDEQMLHEVLDALYRAEQGGALRSDIEEIARYAQVLQYLHEPVVHWPK